MSPRQKSGRDASITIYCTTALKSALEAEAWECERTLSEYLRGLLERRFKWARSVGEAGGYDLAAPLVVPSGDKPG